MNGPIQKFFVSSIVFGYDNRLVFSMLSRYMYMFRINTIRAIFMGGDRVSDKMLSNLGGNNKAIGYSKYLSFRF